MNAHVENDEHEVLGILFKCDPVKNKECKKTDCGVCGNGQKVCFYTTNRNFAVDGEENKPLVVRKPVNVVRIVDAQGKGMHFRDGCFDAKNDIDVYGMSVSRFVEEFEKGLVLELIDKQFKVMMYTPSLYTHLGNGMYNFNRGEMCFEYEVRAEKLNDIYKDLN